MSNKATKPSKKSTKRRLSQDVVTSAAPILFSISLTKFYVLSAISLGLYDLYWFYKNWKGIKFAESSNISPFWRAWFSIFWAYQLFKEVLQYSKKLGYKESYSAGALATVYILLVITVYGMSRIPDTILSSSPSYPIYYFGSIILLTLLTPLALLPVQKAINYNNSQVEGENNFSKHTAGSFVLVAIGCVFFAILTVGLFNAASNNTPSQTTPLSPEVAAAKTEYDSLTAQYNSCSATLTSKQGSLDTTSQAAVDAYNAEYDTCEAVRLKQNEATNKYNALIGQ